jgi:hypothetical protein
MNINKLNKRKLALRRSRLPEKCPNCGLPGPHWVNAEELISSSGFWICPKLYGPDGRRLENSTQASRTFNLFRHVF